MRKFIWLLIIMLLAVSAFPAVMQAETVIERLEAYNSEIPPYGTISADDLGTALIERDIVLLDVREVAEVESDGHIAGSFNVPIRTLSQNLALLPDLDAEIVVICKGGARAMLATAALRTLGYTNVQTLTGGMGGWLGAEFPVTDELFVPEAGEMPDFDPEVFAAVDEFLTTLPEGYGLISADALNVELTENPDLVLIDVRSPDEWDTGYIAGAEFIWINEFMANRDLFPQDLDTPIVIYCGSSYRAGIATVMMRLLGYTNVRNLTGGIQAWNAAQFPLEGVPEVEASEFDLTAYLSDYVSSLPATFNAVRVGDLQTELASDNPPFLLDVRTVDEYAEGHLAGAINIPLNELTANLALLPDLNQNMVVYCGSGHRSAMAMTALNLLGYTNTRSLLGGTQAWVKAELPVDDIPVTAEVGTAPELNPAMFAVVDDYMRGVPQGYYTIRADDLMVALTEAEIALLDVRTAGEIEGGIIEGAITMPLSGMFDSLDKLPPADASIVVYDNPTHRSTMVMMMLQMLGYEDVRTLGGGTGAWESAGLPLVTET